MPFSRPWSATIPRSPARQMHPRSDGLPEGPRQQDLAFAYRGLGVTQQAAGQSPSAAFPREGPDALEGTGPRLPHRHQLSWLLGIEPQSGRLRARRDGAAQRRTPLSPGGPGDLDTQLRHHQRRSILQAERADTINWIAELQSKLGRTAEAIHSYEQARERDPEPGPRSSRGYSVQAGPRHRRHGACRALPQGWAMAEALALLDEAQKLLESLPRDLAHVSLPHGMLPRSSHPARAPRAELPARLRTGRRYGDQAMIELRRSVAGGFKTFGSLPVQTPIWTRSATARTSRLSSWILPSRPTRSRGDSQG